MPSLPTMGEGCEGSRKDTKFIFGNGTRVLDVEPKVNNVPILNDVISSFNVKEAVVFYLLFISQSKEVLVLHDLCPNKSFFEIGMNDARSLWCGRTFPDRPCVDFFWPRGKEGKQMK